jgi:hypothetical protein
MEMVWIDNPSLIQYMSQFVAEQPEDTRGGTDTDEDECCSM